MALFNKFFFSSNKKKTNLCANQNNSSPHFPFDSNQIRILLYRECDANGRRLLFDSNSIQKIVINEQQKQNIKPNFSTKKTKLFDNFKNQQKNEFSSSDGTFIEISNGIGYKHIRPTTSDITNIGEMIFGALAMSLRSPSLKVHWLQAPTRLLCSQVFLSPIPGSNTCCLLNQTDLLGSPSSSNNNLNARQNLKKESNESFDGYSVNSLTSSLRPIKTNRNLSIQFSTLPQINDTTKVQLNGQTQMEINKTTTQSMDAATPTIGSDSGYTTISDCWTSRSSYQYSTRSSMGSVLSDPLSTYDSLRKFSLDSGKSNIVDGENINSSFESTSFSISMQQNLKHSDMNISRRIKRNIQTSFENRNSICDFVGFLGDNNQTAVTNGGSDGCVTNKFNIPQYINAKETHSNPEIRNNNDVNCNSSIFNLFGIPNKNGASKNLKSSIKRSKLGLAVCISMTESHEKEMEEFCCEHIAVIESMLSRLRSSAEYAYLNHKKFLKIMLHAWQKAVDWILDFFTVPRITIPVWYNLTSSDNKSSKNVADNFTKEMCWLLKNSDGKDTNFFLSTMITAVLTHHLGWISTVTSSPSSYYHSNLDSINEFANDKQNILKNTANHFPYNPLWAQMCDLYGAIGNPPKLCRTIVYGKDKNIMEKFLHVLTYFIRCSEIHKCDMKTEFKVEFLNQIPNEKKTKINDAKEKPKKNLSLCRNTTIHKNLSDIRNDSKIHEETYKKCNSMGFLKYNDAKSIKHDLSFSNMGIGYNKDKIKLTVTTPDDVEMILDDESFFDYSKTTTATDNCEALEAIEIQDFSELNIISTLEPPNLTEKLSFWKLQPLIKEGVSLIDMAKLQEISKVQNKYEEPNNSTNLNILNDFNLNSSKYSKASRPQEDKNVSLSNLITENSVGKSERFVWGVEPIKENICSEEEKHFEISQKQIGIDCNLMNSKNVIVNKEKGKGVLFVLGDNEHLVNIKKSNENLSNVEQILKEEPIITNHNKKYSNVKFNIDEYSESIEHFLNKTSNLERISYNLKQKPSKIDKPLNYDFWTKCTCDIKNDKESTSTYSNDLNKSEKYIKDRMVALNACEFCKTNSGEDIKILNKNLQTSYNEINGLGRGGEGDKIKFASSKSASQKNSINLTKKVELQDENISGISSRGLHLKKMFQNLKEKHKKIENINLKVLPMPEIKNSSENINMTEVNDESNIKIGFIPSLFVGITERYIPDMVLQGTVSPFSEWETNIKNDLTIASYCASLIPQTTENIAIIADIDKWEIKIMSSQSNILPYTSSISGPVGMSQLVSQLLEGFYIMSNSGISSFECLAYLESKLKEIYLQSETLAGLLLTTEFCSLNSVITALNLSENDVPLLLAIASIHSPQVTKRYGISFG